MNKLRWGILGAAGIARKNWKAMLYSGNNVVTTVAARDRERAQQFVVECQALHPFEQAPRVLDDYAQVIAASEVDAVYVPLPTALRKEWVIRAAEAGKHVLCEKPCALTAEDLRAMIAACQRNGVQFMDGVMFQHSPRLPAVRAVLADATRIGSLRRISSVFSFLGDEKNFHRNIRVQSALEPAGCLGDLGWYCLRISLFAANWELPGLVSGRILSVAADGQTPTQFSGEMIFDHGLSAGFYCSFVSESQQWAVISGARGTLRISDFVHPRNSYEPAFEINATEHRVLAPAGTLVPVHAGPLGEPSHPSAQDSCLFRNFATQVQSGKLEPLWPEIALKTQLVQDACLASARDGGKLMTVAMP